MNTIEKKLTRASFKKFVQDNKDNLYILVKMDFDSMTDCIQQVDMVPRKVNPSEIDLEDKYKFGINGVWLVGRSRDSFSQYEDELFVGIHVANSCGSFNLAKMK